MSLFDLSILFTSVLLSGSAFFFIKNPSQRVLKLLLSFSGAYLFAISVLHLLPEVYTNGGPGIGLWVMLGFFLQILLELFSEGIEHGHIHIHKTHSAAFPGTMMISLSLHSFLEGMPLSGMNHDNEHVHSLLYGIVMHHIPVAFALVSMLSASGVSRMNTFLLLLLFAAMAPFGAIAGLLFQKNIGSIDFFPQVMGIVIGIFLHISTTILFESSSDHRFNLHKLLAIVTGGIIGIVSLWL